jgi:hypothetical protein
MATNSPLPKLGYNIGEFAEAADLSESFVRAEIARNELETCLAGDRRIITPDQAARWLERKAERARQKQAERERRRAAKP